MESSMKPTKKYSRKMEKSAVIEEVAAFSSTFFEHYNVPIRSPPCSDLISISKIRSEER